MTRRSTITLAVVTALLAVLALLDRGRVTRGEREARRGRLLTSLVRERLERVEIERPGAPRVVLVAVREEAGELASWRLEQPVREPADDEAVGELLSQLDWAEPQRWLRDVGAEDRERFGLSEPRAVVRLQVGAERIVLRLGGEDPTGAGVYAEVEGSGSVAVVGEDLLRRVERPAWVYRRKEVFADLPLDRVVSVRVRDEQGERLVEREGGRWWLRRPFVAFASRRRVSEMLRAMEDLQAARFVEGEVDGTGLEQPWLQVAVTWRADGGEAHDGGAGGAGADREAVLRVGATCGEHDGERYARLGRDGPLWCVRVAGLEPLRVPARQLRDERIVDVEVMDLASVELRAGGHRLLLRRVEDAQTEGEPWELLLDDEVQSRRVGEAEVRRLLDLLAGLKVARFEPLTEASLRAAGLERPDVELRFAFLEELDRAEERLGVSRSQGADGAAWTWFRRDEEPLLLGLPGDLVTLVRPDPGLFRDPLLLTVAEERVAAVELRPEGAERAVRLERTTEGWRVADHGSASGLPAEVTVPLVRALSTLRAEHFVPEAAAPSVLGLDRPVLVVRWALSPSGDGRADSPTPGTGGGAEANGTKHWIELRLGVEAPGGGRFAEVVGLPGEAPTARFVISGEVARDLLAAVERTGS